MFVSTAGQRNVQAFENIEMLLFETRRARMTNISSVLSLEVIHPGVKGLVLVSRNEIRPMCLLVRQNSK